MITRHINDRTPLCPHRERLICSLSHKLTRTNPLLPSKRHITHKVPSQHQSINTLRLPNQLQRPDKRRPEPDSIQISPNHLLLIMNITQTCKRKQRLVRTPLSKVRHTHHTQHTPYTQPTKHDHIRYRKKEEQRHLLKQRSKILHQSLPHISPQLPTTLRKQHTQPLHSPFPHLRPPHLQPTRIRCMRQQSPIEVTVTHLHLLQPENADFTPLTILTPSHTP